MSIKNFAPAGLLLATLSVFPAAIASADIQSQGASQQSQQGHSSSQHFPEVPAPDPSQAKVPDGFHVDVVLTNLTYPTSAEFDNEGNLFVAEAGYSYGDEAATPRLFRVSPGGEIHTVTEELEGPVNDLLWHEERLYISHRGKISVLDGSRVRDLVTGLPSDGDHQNNQMSAGPDGKIYFGQGTASNSGVVGTDNYKMGWLKKHPGFHDIPAKDIRLRGQEFKSQNPFAPQRGMARTAAFNPFGNTAPAKAVVQGTTKAGGTILRMNPDGSELAVYAWGLRNPFGVCWANDKLFVSENGLDVRGSRPVANDKEDLYEIREGAWYGWPDFASGIPVTDPQFKPADKPAPEFLMASHPKVEKPVMTFPPHSAATKLTVNRSREFGEKEDLFLAFFGHMAPMTGKVEQHGGHRVLRLNPQTGQQETFFSKTDHHGGEHTGGGDDSGQKTGHNGKDESITAGPRRLMDVVFSPNGDALYVVDFGSMVVKDKPMPIRNTGVVWRITPKGKNVTQPPSNLSVPGFTQEAAGAGKENARP